VINEISSWIAQQKNDQTIFQRLTNDAQSKQIDFEDENCTFQPNHKRDTSMVSSDSKLSKFDDFLERQKK